MKIKRSKNSRYRDDIYICDACKTTDARTNITSFVTAVIEVSENEHLCEQCAADRDIDLSNLSSQCSLIRQKVA